MGRKTIISLALLLALTANNNFCNAQNQPPYEVNVTQNINFSSAENYEKQGNYDKALDIYNSALETNPNATTARLKIANIYRELYKIKAAQREYNKVLKQNSKNSDAHNGLGLTYYYQTTSSNMDYRLNIGTLYRKAIDEFSAAIEANPMHDDAIANLGMIYQHQGRSNKAYQKFKEALSINPNNSNANYMMGAMMYEQGDIDTAIDYYKKSIAIDSKNSSAYYRLGEALINKGLYSNAIEALQTSLYLQPNSAPVYEKLGEAYKHQGNETAAIESFKKSIMIKPEDTLPYLLLANIYENRGDEELAITELKSALKNNPDFSEAKFAIANMSLKIGKTTQAIEYYKSALVDDPGNPQCEKGLSKAYFKKVQQDVASGIVTSPASLLEAEKYVLKAMAIDPDDLELHYAKFKLEKLTNKPPLNNSELEVLAQESVQNLSDALDKGYALFNLKDFDKANNIFRGVVNQITTQNNNLIVAETLIEYKNYAIAQEIFDAILTSDPNNIQAKRGIEKIRKNKQEAIEAYRLGWDLYKKGQRKSAIDQFYKAQDINPMFEKAYYWAAETLKKEKNYESAYNNYKTFLALIDNQNNQEKLNELEKNIKNAQKQMKKLEKKINN